MTNAEIVQLFDQQSVPEEPAEVTPEEMDQTHTVAATSDGKVLEAPVNFQGLITKDQDALSEAARKYQIVLEGVCSNCAHCSMPLRDAVSVQRGIGPVCSRRGYKEDPEDPGDPVEAMIFLAKWPHLVNFLVEKSKGLETGDVRNLLNGLVRICSLNRKTEVHDACTDAIETLGYNRLASMLRESLCVAEIKKSDGNPNFLVLWVKKSEWTPQWTADWRQVLSYSRFSKLDKGMLFKRTDKQVVWRLLIKHYEGLCIKTPDGKAARIKRPESEAP